MAPSMSLAGVLVESLKDYFQGPFGLEPSSARAIAVGPQAGRKVFTLQTFPASDPVDLFGSAVGNVAGFSLHAEVAAKAHERKKLEWLCRYSLIAVGGRDDGLDARRPIGLRLELVPLTPVYHLKPGQPLEVKLLYENRPLANVQVMAYSKTQPKARLLQRTDANGRARFVLPHADVWLLSAVHMIPAPDDAKADWESFWASLTFDTDNQR